MRVATTWKGHWIGKSALRCKTCLRSATALPSGPFTRARTMANKDIALCVGRSSPSYTSLWQRHFWQGKVKDIPEQWKQRLEAGTEPELWQRGLVQSIFYIKEGGMGTFQNEGLWTTEAAFDIPAAEMSATSAMCLSCACTRSSPSSGLQHSRAFVLGRPRRAGLSSMD